MDGGDHLREAGGRARPTEQTARAGVDQNDGGAKLCGSRNSGDDGIVVTVHVRTSWEVRSAPGSVLSTGVCSDASFACRSHGGDMAGGRRLSASVANAARGRVRPREKRERMAGLTSSLTEGSAGSGTTDRQRIDDEELRAPSLKMTMVATLWCVRARVACRGGRGHRGASVGHGGEARQQWWLRLWRWRSHGDFGRGGRRRARGNGMLGFVTGLGGGLYRRGEATDERHVAICERAAARTSRHGLCPSHGGRLTKGLVGWAKPHCGH
jgi:hypothetical protein